MINLKEIEFHSITKEFYKNSFGEVFTPNILIEEMLEKLPNEIWQNENLKWLDPAAGVGNFHVVVYKKLLIGLKNKFNSEEDLKKHILENMLYFVEIQDKNVNLINTFFNPDFKYNLNILHSDFLEMNIFDFGIMHFDIVLGNPPYQEMQNENERKAKNHNLWSSFIEKGFSVLNKNGFLLYITPPAWMSPSSKVLKDIFLKFQLTFVNIGECSKHFKGVGSQFSYFLIEKKTVYKETIFQYNFKGNSFINSKSDFSTFQLKENIKFIPQLPAFEAFKILEKTVFKKNRKFSIEYDSDLHRFTKKEFLSIEKNEIYKYKILHTPTQIFWSSKPHKNQEKIKLFIPLTTYYESMFIENCGNTQGLGYLTFNSFEQAENVKKILSSKLYRFIANITRWSNFNVPMVMKNLPFFPQNIEISDRNIYTYFNISTTEIKFIESFIKENRFE